MERAPVLWKPDFSLNLAAHLFEVLDGQLILVTGLVRLCNLIKNRSYRGVIMRQVHSLAIKRLLVKIQGKVDPALNLK